jgi:hypothetical protein
MTGPTSCFYFNEVTRQRLTALAKEFGLSKSATLRILIGNAWQTEREGMRKTAEGFDAAATQSEAEMLRMGVDPVEMLMKDKR